MYNINYIKFWPLTSPTTKESFTVWSTILRKCYTTYTNNFKYLKMFKIKLSIRPSIILSTSTCVEKITSKGNLFIAYYIFLLTGFILRKEMDMENFIKPHLSISWHGISKASSIYKALIKISIPQRSHIDISYFYLIYNFFRTYKYFYSNTII